MITMQQHKKNRKALKADSYFKGFIIADLGRCASKSYFRVIRPDGMQDFIVTDGVIK
jgi:hypothetical protein